MHEKELAILKTAITNEHEGRQFYLLAAEKAPEGEVRDVFLFLAGEEEEHESYLKKLYGDIVRKERPTVEAFPLSRAESPGVFTREKLSGAGSLVVSALHIGVMMEKSSADYYREAAGRTGIAELKELYEKLANWEMDHLRRLEEAYDFAREEWWDRQNFSPA